MAVKLKQCTFDPIMAKQNVLEKNIYILPLKHILDLPTKGHQCAVSVLKPINFDNFQSEHPVESVTNMIFWA